MGAIDALTKQIITVTNTTYITSIEISCLLVKLDQQAAEAVPVTVVLDNARYQRCRLATDKAAELNIELLFLPPYSPNLNLIERLWKFVKKKCLYSKFYDTFDKFQRAVSECLENANLKHQKELESLLTLRFQTFENSQFMTV